MRSRTSGRSFILRQINLAIRVGRVVRLAIRADDEGQRQFHLLAEEIRPAFVGLIEGRKFVPKYVEVVSSTPDEILNAASA